MKVKKKPMPLAQKIFYVISFFFLFFAFAYLGTKDYQASEKSLNDNEKFTEEYGITKENLYVYKNASEILEILNSGSAVIFLGFPENEWSSMYANILNDAAKRLSIQEIDYYNVLEDRKRGNHYYENIVKKLASYLPVLDSGETNIYVPAVVLVKNGQIIAYDDETSIMRGNEHIEDFWTEQKIEEKRLELGVLLTKYKESK